MKSGRAVNLGVTLLMVLVAQFGMAAGPQAKYATGSPESKELTVTERFHYIERVFAPQVALPRVSDPPESVNMPEQGLISQFSSIDALDYDWWLSTWDDDSQKKLLERDVAAGKTKKDWQQQWQTKAGKMNVVLTRWIMSGQYVILAYTLSTSDQKAAGTLPETAMAFKQWKGSWKATLDLESDPVLLHFADTKNRFERVVRP